MFGDILSDEASEISGSLGLAGSTMAGDEACCAQAQHGSAPDIAGKGIANPTGLMLSAALMLDHIEQRDAAERLRKGVRTALANPETRTGDLGGKTNTAGYTDAVIRAMG
jgi:3-isopropylmalate dehydrogenase